LSVDWYVHLKGESQGPYSKKDLQEMVASGDLKEDDYICLAGMPRWIRAYEVEGLFAPSSSPVSFPPVGSSKTPPPSAGASGRRTFPSPPPPPVETTGGAGTPPSPTRGQGMSEGKGTSPPSRGSSSPGFPPPPATSPERPEGTSTPPGPPPPPGGTSSMVPSPPGRPGLPDPPRSSGSKGPPPPPVAKGPSSHPSQFPGGGQGTPGGQVPGKGSNTILKVSVLLASLIIVFGGIFAGGWWMWNSFMGGEVVEEGNLEDTLGVIDMEEEEGNSVKTVLEEGPAVNVEDFASHSTDGPVEMALHTYILDVYKTDEYKLFPVEVMEEAEEEFFESYQKGQIIFIYSYEYVGDYVEALLDDPFSDYAFGLILEQVEEGWIASRYIEQ